MNAQCACGKRMVVSDALVGKTIRCSSCGNTVLVKGAPIVAGKPQQANPSFYISPTTITLAVVVGGLLVTGLLFYFGPMRASRQWEAMDQKATGSVRNMIVFALKVYTSANGNWDPSKPGNTPWIESHDVQWNRPMMSWGLPRKIEFVGKSNRGSFSGLYDTESGEIEADVLWGGRTIAGMVDLAKTQGGFHMLGKEINGKDPEVTVDGKPLKIVYNFDR